MEIKNGKQRPSQKKGRNKTSQPEGESRSVGDVSDSRRTPGNHQIRASGEDSNESNTLISGEQSLSSIPGKIIGQLVDETEKQLAYHEQQAEVLRGRLKELKQVPASLTEISNSE